MGELLKELLVLYEDKRTKFIDEIQPESSSFKENFIWSQAPKIEDIIDEESSFYLEILSDMAGIEAIRGKTIDRTEWENLLFVLNNHNERLACRTDNNGALATVIALTAAFLGIMAQFVHSSIWATFIFAVWSGFQTFSMHVKDRHSLSRNRELMNIIERYLFFANRL